MQSMQSIPFDIYANIASWCDPIAFFALSKTCRQFHAWRDHPHIFQQFHQVNIDRHLEAGHVALLRYKHSKGEKCSYSTSARGLTIAFEQKQTHMLKYLFSVGKMIEGHYVYQLAAACTLSDLHIPIRDHVGNKRLLLQFAISQRNLSLVLVFPAAHIFDALQYVSVDAEGIIRESVRRLEGWDRVYPTVSQRALARPTSALCNLRNEEILIAEMMRKYPEHDLSRYRARFVPVTPSRRSSPRCGIF